MSSLFLTLESSLADARAELEKAGESLHEASIQAAQKKVLYDAAADVVRRLEGALSALHGDIVQPMTAVIGALPKHKPKPKAEGPICDGCGEAGTLVRQGPLIVCTACQAQKVA